MKIFLSLLLFGVGLLGGAAYANCAIVLAGDFDPVSNVERHGLDPTKIKIASTVFDRERWNLRSFTLVYDDCSIGDFVLERNGTAVSIEPVFSPFFYCPHLQGKGLGTYLYLAVARYAYRQDPTITSIDARWGMHEPTLRAMWERFVAAGLAVTVDGRPQLVASFFRDGGRFDRLDAGFLELETSNPDRRATHRALGSETHRR